MNNGPQPEYRVAPTDTIPSIRTRPSNPITMALRRANTQQILQSALEAELTEHLGYDLGDRAGKQTPNSRNGSTPKTVRTEIGDLTVQVPRDRAGTFAPVVVPKHQRRIAGFDEAVISLYAKGMTTGDIAKHLSDLYGSEVSRGLVSTVTDAVVADMQEWQARPLDVVYPVVLIDALVIKVRDGQVANRPVYVAVGIDLDGHRDVLGLWMGPTGGEGAKQWMNMLTELGMSGRRRNGLSVTGIAAASTARTLPTFTSSRGATATGRRRRKPLASRAPRVMTPVSITTAQSVVGSSRRVLKARQIRRRLTRGSSRTGRTPSILARLCVRSLAGRRNRARRLRASCSNAPVAVSPANRADNADGVSLGSE